MFISKKHLSRRTVLRGVGSCIALPLLDAMIPARRRARQDFGSAAHADGVRRFSTRRGDEQLVAHDRW